MQTTDQTMRWVWRGGAAAVIVLGWIFILVFNNFHVTPPVVFVALGYLAAVATIYNLFHTGVAVVTDEDEDNADTTWGRPIGATAELEREKKTLLKAIKEAEFDLQMGKLSQKDADEMIRVYRLRAIEVIKELDAVENRGSTKTAGVREEIEREVRARLEVEGKARKKGAADAKQKKQKKQQQQQQQAAKKAEKKADGEKSDDKKTGGESKKAEKKADDEKSDDKKTGGESKKTDESKKTEAKKTDDKKSDDKAESKKSDGKKTADDDTADDETADEGKAEDAVEAKTDDKKTDKKSDEANGAKKADAADDDAMPERAKGRDASIKEAAP